MVKTLGEVIILSATFAALPAPKPLLFPRIVTLSSSMKSVVNPLGVLPVRKASITLWAERWKSSFVSASPTQKVVSMKIKVHQLQGGQGPSAHYDACWTFRSRRSLSRDPCPGEP